MLYYDQEILNGLNQVPTPNSPGSLIVTGDSQAVLTGLIKLTKRLVWI